MDQTLFYDILSKECYFKKWTNCKKMLVSKLLTFDFSKGNEDHINTQCMVLCDWLLRNQYNESINEESSRFVIDVVLNNNRFSINTY